MDLNSDAVLKLRATVVLGDDSRNVEVCGLSPLAFVAMSREGRESAVMTPSVAGGVLCVGVVLPSEKDTVGKLGDAAIVSEAENINSAICPAGVVRRCEGLDTDAREPEGRLDKLLVGEVALEMAANVVGKTVEDIDKKVFSEGSKVGRLSDVKIDGIVSISLETRPICDVDEVPGVK